MGGWIKSTEFAPSSSQNWVGQTTIGNEKSTTTNAYGVQHTRLNRKNLCVTVIDSMR
jgi:hypothetical protein